MEQAASNACAPHLVPYTAVPVEVLAGDRPLDNLIDGSSCPAAIEDSAVEASAVDAASTACLVHTQSSLAAGKCADVALPVVDAGGLHSQAQQNGSEKPCERPQSGTHVASSAAAYAGYGDEAEHGVFTMCLEGEAGGVMAKHAEKCQDACDRPAVADDAAADGNTCAICLDQIQATDLAIVKGCEHVYCVYCILQWAEFKETPWCPQCKTPFTYLFCHRHLDGTLSDFAIEESVTLLKRATWFQQHMKAMEKGKQVCAEDASPRERHTEDWYQEFYEDFDDGNEDEEIEDFYFSRAAGHARIVIANRRWGENGYMRSGRMYATPSAGSSSHGKAKSKGAGKSGKAQLAYMQSSTPAAGGVMMGSSPLGSSPPGRGGCVASSPAAGSGSTSKPGRRAKRNAKRVAADGGVDF